MKNPSALALSLPSSKQMDHPVNKSNTLHTPHAAVCAIAVALVGGGIASAQTTPDAGALLKQIEQQRPVPLPPQSAPQFMPPPPLQSLGGATVTVTAFRFAGNTLLSAEQLVPSVSDFLNRPLNFSELQNAAIAVAAAYRKAGWVVRVYLPQQDIQDGMVTIQVVEAVLGAVQLQGESKRISAATLKSMVEAAQPLGTPVNGDLLDRALLLIDDLPGLNASGRLSEGQNQAETDLVLDVADSSLITGEITADNTGSRSTGSDRISGNANLNSPLGLGDLASASLIYTQGSDYLRAAYSLPVGNQGWRLGVNASHLSYKVVTPDASALDAQGTSTTSGVDANYPLVRSRQNNLYFAFTFDQKSFDNRSAGASTTRYKTQIASVGLNGNVFDNLGGGGANTANIAFVQGRVDLTGSPNEAADAASTQTADGFNKLRFGASRQQVLTDTVSLFAGLSGQVASKNLDSSEKFYLGGSSGVRAYPASEGAGSEGRLLNLEVRTRLPDNFTLTGFYDWGSVLVNKNNSIAGAAALNSYDLKGVGLSLSWASTFGLSVKASLAHRIGDNPNPTPNGNDQDGSLNVNRFWLQASMPF